MDGRALPLLVVGVLASSCIGDPAGVRGPILSLVNGDPDSVWIGSPGTPLPAPIEISAVDAYGRALPGVTVKWVVLGQGASILAPQTSTNASGQATATWVLGTNAAEAQEFHAIVETPTHTDSLVIKARAVPSVVAGLAIGADTALMLRVGDSLSLTATATDPFGNKWTPAAVLSTADSATLGIAGGRLFGRARRGIAVLRATSQGVSATCLVHVTQFVAAINVPTDTLRFSSLGISQPLTYAVLDDRNRLVPDTFALVAVGDSAIAVVGGGLIISRAPGVSNIVLNIGTVSTNEVVSVHQRIVRLQFQRDSLAFQALADTAALKPVGFDSAGYPVVGANLSTTSSDQNVVIVSGTVARSVGQGTARITGLDPASGTSATIPAVVAQTPTALAAAVSQRDGYSFVTAAGDSFGNIVATDHNGFALPEKALSVAWTDTSIVRLDSVGLLRAQRSGVTHVHVVAGSLTLDTTVVVVLPPTIIQPQDANFSVAGYPDSLSPWAPTAVGMPDGTVRLYFAGYVPDSINTPPFVADLHYAVSSDSVHFTYGGVALKHDSSYSGYRSLGLENVYMVPRDDGPGCRLYVSGGSSWWIWQIWSAVASDCKTWQWENGPALPGVIENDTIGRPTGEGMTAWQDSTGGWWMLAGVYPPVFGGLRTWTIGLYHGTDERHWNFVNTVEAPGPPGSGMNRAVYGPSISTITPGLYRMFFTGDNADLSISPGSSYIFSAVSRDRIHWEFEGTALDLHLPNQGPRYATVLGNHLYFVVNGAAYRSHLASAQILQP